MLSWWLAATNSRQQMCSECQVRLTYNHWIRGLSLSQRSLLKSRRTEKAESKNIAFFKRQQHIVKIIVLRVFSKSSYPRQKQKTQDPCYRSLSSLSFLNVEPRGANTQASRWWGISSRHAVSQSRHQKPRKTISSFRNLARNSRFVPPETRIQVKLATRALCTNWHISAHRDK